MRAIVLHHGTARLVPTHPEPDPGHGAVVRVARSAVTPFDVAVARGLLPHEGVAGGDAVGVVEACAAQPELVGRRVAIAPWTWCGICDRCVGGLREHCRARGLRGAGGLAGGLAERTMAAPAGLVPLPDHVDDDTAIFASLVAAALQTRRQVAVGSKVYVTVLGCGPLGLVTAQLLAPLNERVRVVGRHAENLALCEKWGIRHRLESEVGRRADQDVVIDCTGRAEGLAVALSLVRARGLVILKSLAESAPATMAREAVLHEITLAGSFGGPMRDAVEVLARGGVDVASLVARRIGLDDAVERLARGAGRLRTVVRP